MTSPSLRPPRTTRGGRTYVSTCDRNNSYHRWQWIAQGDGFQLRSQGTGRCLANDGSRIVTRTCNAGDIHQTWFTSPDDFARGAVKLLNKGSSYYLAYDSGIGLTGTTSRQYSWYLLAI
ncbi:RICIN domain-containing protein [Streptomyces sp. NPDC055107]